MNHLAEAKPLGRIAQNRLQKELRDWQRKAPAGLMLHQSENLQKWLIEISGAPGTLYDGETFYLQLQFPENYPMESPEAIFIRKAPIHPHIYSNGHICLDILYDSWSPAMTVSTLCLSILSMLSSCTEKVPPPDDERYVRKNVGKSPKDTKWWFHDDQV